ncbi:unnamed protein product (mitochondrion) [Plasmodiophora brassicae]|uniref:Sphingomyelin synthase-like domain-containing protein n=2 Tax=Plasmodiophora brassicae TaxID=37360 RepID=A0A3P3YBJ8_PLABS|nr:unnamed protein product [Plasmodiophora brassicae]
MTWQHWAMNSIRSLSPSSSSPSDDAATSSEIEDLLDSELGSDYSSSEFDCQPQSKALLRPMPVAIAFALGATTLNSMFQVLSERRYQVIRGAVLPDIGHDLGDVLPFGMPSPIICDILLVVLLGITVCRFACDPCLRWDVLRRYLVLQGIVFLIRGPALYMTVLPQTIVDPFECQFASAGNLLLDTAFVVMRMSVTCTDLFFSGHAAMMMLFVLFVTVHTSPMSFKPIARTRRSRQMAYWALMTASWTVTIAGISMIVMTKFHYSIDVYIGVLLPVILFVYYYDLLDAPAPDTRPRPSLPHRIVHWLESKQYKAKA